jgi:hypothetical protein
MHKVSDKKNKPANTAVHINEVLSNFFSLTYKLNIFNIYKIFTRLPANKAAARKFCRFGTRAAIKMQYYRNCNSLFRQYSAAEHTITINVILKVNS